MDILSVFDPQTLELQCPRCNFYNEFFYKQARLEDIIICRGCKTNIVLNDSIGSIKKANKEIQKTMNDFEKQLKNISNITIKI